MADFPQAQNLNPPLTGALRDPAKMQKDQVMAWMAEKRKEQALQERGGGGFIQGLAPLIAAGVATKAPALGLLELLSQFENNRAEKTRRRDIQEEEIPDLGMAFPVFGVGKTGRLASAMKRLAQKPDHELPMFTPEGLMAPARQKELASRMKNWIPNTSNSDPAKVAKQFDEWMALQDPRFGTAPLSKEKILDKMPKELRSSLYESLKEMGYRGIRTGAVSERNSRNPQWKPGMRESYTLPEHTTRTWEELQPFLQEGGTYKGWEKAFKALQEIEAARPPAPKTKTAGR